MITVKIDLTKIEKKRIFEGKNGAKYIDIVLIDSPNDKYNNDYMVIQQVSKEERDKGIKGPILGNGKIIGGGSKNQSETSASTSHDDLPY